jgi:tripartite-type tricarboxylate transporter receptor subunit TctC
MKSSLFALVLVLGFSAHAEAQTPYYQGKTIRLIVGYPAGSTHDAWARLVGAYLTKHIAGNPNTIVQNMPGAGSAVAANYVFGVAKPDGLSIAVVNAGLYFDQLLGRKEVQYDWGKFAWVGSSTRSNTLLYMAAQTPFKTIQDVRGAATPPKCGSTGSGNSGYYVPKLLEETIGTKFQIVSGYQGGSDIDLAVERGEVHCRAISIPVYFGREPYHSWRKTGFARVLIQTGNKRDARIADVPTLNELMEQYQTAPLARRLASVVNTSAEFGAWPAMTSPNTPAEYLKILRAAFVKSVNDPELLAEAKKKTLDVELITGEEAEALAREVVNQPAEIVARLKKLLGN